MTRASKEEAGSGGADTEFASTGPANAEEAARQICLRMLTAAPRTRAQLAGALSRRGVPQQVADEVLGRFTEAGLVDDATFASAWVESRHYSRGLARRALAAELTQRGVSPEETAAAVGQLREDQEIATARALVARSLAGTRGRPAQVRIRRLMGVLARKGYPPAMSFRLVREALEQEGLGAAAEELGLDDPPEPYPAEDTTNWP